MHEYCGCDEQKTWSFLIENYNSASICDINLLEMQFVFLGIGQI
jgi:hypothetical protein